MGGWAAKGRGVDRWLGLCETDLLVDNIRQDILLDRLWSTMVRICLAVLLCRIEPDGQRPRVILHGRACRQPASDKCSYKTDDTTHSVTEGIMYTVDVTVRSTG